MDCLKKEVSILSSKAEIDAYFSGNDVPNNSIGNYFGNPNYLNLLPSDKSYQDITLQDLGFTSDLVKFELKGMVNDLINPETGEDYEEADYDSLINLYAAQAETKFDIVLRPRLVVDRQDYFRNDFDAYMYLRTKERPILHVEDVKVYFNNQSIFDYDDTWIKVTNRMGQVQIQPALFMQAYANAYQMPFNMPDRLYGVPPVVQNEYAPQMLGITYVAGMLPQDSSEKGINREVYVRPELQAWVSKKVAIGILERWGRNIIGPGIASYSVSIDNISSDLNTTQSAEYSATKAEIDTLNEEISQLEESLKAYYGGNNVGIIV